LTRSVKRTSASFCGLWRFHNVFGAFIIQEYNPIWYEFGMFTGGILPLPQYKKLLNLIRCYGYNEFHPEGI